jgi:hypothetical protein
LTHGRIKQKYTTKDAHNKDTFNGSIGFIDNKKWTKSTTMDIMTKKGSVSYFSFPLGTCPCVFIRDPIEEKGGIRW